jgi:hypothetical protein
MVIALHNSLKLAYFAVKWVAVEFILVAAFFGPFHLPSLL